MTLLLVCRGCHLEVAGQYCERTELLAHAEKHQRMKGKDHITHVIPKRERDDFERL